MEVAVGELLDRSRREPQLRVVRRVEEVLRLQVARELLIVDVDRGDVDLPRDLLEA
jgi:hypothetical protein